MRDVSVIGAGMVKFGKYIDTSMKVLGRDAVNNALASAGLEKQQIEAAVVGNALIDTPAAEKIAASEDVAAVTALVAVSLTVVLDTFVQ